MSGSYFDPDWAAKVTVPVKRVGARWEFFFIGARSYHATCSAASLADLQELGHHVSAAASTRFAVDPRALRGAPRRVARASGLFALSAS